MNDIQEMIRNMKDELQHMKDEYEKQFNHLRQIIDFQNEQIKMLIDIKFETNEISHSTMLNKLKVWKGVYDVFVSDAKTFNDIVSGLDFWALQDCNYDAKKYAEITKDSTNEGKVNFFLSYYKNIEKLNTYALNLINN